MIFDSENTDSLILRKIMGKFTTGVAIATTIDDEANPVGITINSLTSVSLNPPLILFCIAKNSGTLNAFINAQNFVINILSKQQIEISRRFSKFNIDKFSDIQTSKTQNNIPFFEKSLAVYECEKTQIYEGGDHYIFIGEIKKAKANNEAEPLVYYSGHYTKIMKAEE